MKDVSKIGIALVAGAVAGAIAGLLLAPEEGAKTRKKLSKKAKKMEEKIKEKSKEFSEKAKEKSKEFSEKAKEFKGKAEGYLSKASDLKDEVIKTAEGYL